MTASINQTEHQLNIKKQSVKRPQTETVSESLCNCEQPPVVEYPVDDHPLWFNAVAVEALLHHSVVGVFALPLLVVELLLSGAVVVRRGLVHVVLTLVVPIHDGVIQLQLHNHRRSKNNQFCSVSFRTTSG